MKILKVKMVAKEVKVELTAEEVTLIREILFVFKIIKSIKGFIKLILRRP